MSNLPNQNPAGNKAVKEYLLANPQLPSRTIARHLFTDKKYVGVWPNVEAVRSSVRKLRGASGKVMRKEVPIIAPPSPLSHSVAAIEENPFYCPPSDKVEWKPHVVTVPSEDKTLILCDIHFPYHDPEAIRIAIREGKRRGIKRIILLGDQMDMYQLSRFSRDPRLRSFKGEIDMAKTFLEALREEFDDIEIIWKDGNHEERYQHLLEGHAKELIGVAEFEFRILMDFHNLGVTYVADKRPIHLGHNILVHGHEFGQQIFSPVNPARGLFLRAKHTAACGHHHATSEHSERNLDDKSIVCWSIACLSDLHPPYRPINNFGHGFAIQTTLPNGQFDFANHRILDGRVI